MAEPQRQVEVQLGHLCNNRCVFCVSGQLSEQKRAPQLPPEPIRRQIEAARRNGATKITFLGGEPTLQRSFFDLLRWAVTLDFDEIVIFTNGTMTPRESFRERALAVLDGLGPEMKKRVIWRFSLQGGEEQAHDLTTMNPGAWARIYKSLEILHGEQFRLTGNMCVVESNYRTVASLADVAQRFSFENLHLDMVRPRDSGDRTEAELRAMMARYTDMAPSLRALSTRVDQLLGGDFDLNFGNVPYCTALDVAHRIHHDGQETVTVAADGEGNTQAGFNKYEDKRVDKRKTPGCAGCVFADRCSGVFDTYRKFYGDAEFVAVMARDLWARDTDGHHLVLTAKSLLAAPLADGRLRLLQEDERAQELTLGDAAGQASVVVRRAGRRAHALARQARAGWLQLHTPSLEFSVVLAPKSPQALRTLVTELAALLAGEALPESEWARFGPAWQAEEARLQQVQQRRQQARRQLIAVVERLRLAPVAGLAVVQVAAQDDAAGSAALVTWREAGARTGAGAGHERQARSGRREGASQPSLAAAATATRAGAAAGAPAELELLVSVADDARPRFALQGSTASASQLAAFNAALAERLRGPARSTDRSTGQNVAKVQGQSIL